MEGTGRIHFIYGPGKGKTTSVVGMAIRGVSRNLSVLFYQFLQDNSSGERAVLEEIAGITCLPGPDRVKAFKHMNGDEKKQWKRYYLKAFDEIVKFCTGFDILILDNMLDVISQGIISEDKLFTFLDHKPRGLEVVMTGQEITDRMRAKGDYITYMEKEKHPGDDGKISRAGIEY